MKISIKINWKYRLIYSNSSVFIYLLLLNGPYESLISAPFGSLSTGMASASSCYFRRKLCSVAKGAAVSYTLADSASIN